MSETLNLGKNQGHQSVMMALILQDASWGN